MEDAERQAALLLQRLLDMLSDLGGQDTAVRRRVEGAAIALEVASESGVAHDQPG